MHFECEVGAFGHEAQKGCHKAATADMKTQAVHWHLQFLSPILAKMIVTLSPDGKSKMYALYDDN